MLIAGFPAGDEQVASSRLRYFALATYLRPLGARLEEGGTGRADLLYVQKRLTPELLAEVRAARAANRPVVYDVDDRGLALGMWAPRILLDEMLALASIVTVSTEEQAEELRAERTGPIEIVPNMVDYGAESCARPRPLGQSPLRIAWFGNRINIRLLSRYAAVLSEVSDAKIVIITNPMRLPEPLAGCEIRAWQRETFVADLQTCHLTCLMHDGVRADRSKSNTRMVTSIAWGVPAIVSRTGEYARTALDSGVGDALFAGIEDVRDVVERFRSEDARQAYLDRAQPAIWARYAPEAITRRMLAVFERALHAREV